MKKMYEKPEVFSEGAFETLGDTGCTQMSANDPWCDPIKSGVISSEPSN